jgi:ABC-type Fe3+-hydroxamate transport system substrate-binding protein
MAELEKAGVPTVSFVARDFAKPWQLHGSKFGIEELPGVNSHGRTLDEARETLQKLAAVVFDEERREAEELIAGKDVVRESFFVPIPRPA